MLTAASSMGGRNEARSVASVRLKEGTKQHRIGGSEKQAEVSGLTMERSASTP